jgi:hypothetical protein
MNVKSLSGLLAVGALLLAATPVFAHHSAVAEFDMNKEAVVKATLTKVLWSNPHVYFYATTTDASGKVTEYRFQSGTPLNFHRSGVMKDDFKIGDSVTVTYNPSKDGTNTYGWMKMIKYSDGHVFVYRVGSE